MKTNTIPPAPSIQTYALDLGDGVKCTARIDFERIAALPMARLQSLIGFHWQGQPRNAHFPAAAAWVQQVWQCLANATRRNFLIVLRPPCGEPFAVRFAPEQPRRVIPLPRQ